MSELKWFFPESGAECLELFDAGFQPHGGGTFLIKTALNIKGVFDTGRVDGYRILDETKSSIIIGSAVSYAEASAYVENLLSVNIFSSALTRAASTPLRNRITVGGSIAAAPAWSDIPGPLAASGASVVIEGSDDRIDYYKYASDRSLRRSGLVSSIIIPKDSLKGRYFRFTLTGFDYPFFTISVSFLRDGEFRSAVSGTKKGLLVFSGDSKAIINKASDTILFNDERGMSGGYIKTRALVELKRMLTAPGGSDE